MIPILKQLDLQRLASDKKKLMIAAIVCLMIIILDVIFVMKLQLSVLGTQGPKIVKLKKELQALDNDLQKMQSLKSKDGNKRFGVVLKKSIVPEGQITTLLQNISETAKKYGIRISQMKQSSEAQPGKQAPSLIPYLISLDLTADYHTFGKFLNQLENGDIFIAVQDLRISPGTQNAISQSCFVTLKTYVKK
jgi:Tfp pilus assembly protein PilO